MKKDDELETTNSDKSRSELEKTDLVEWVDSDEPNMMNQVERESKAEADTEKKGSMD